MADEKKIREIYGVKSVLDEAAERIEATWREKLLRETGDLRTVTHNFFRKLTTA
ncbi:hypothetical protein [Collinsella sp. AF37-9]|uniref:hypothetical protein n=1 Tax=Collinsella sp. AF37-9 TaxID=2292014 RepID=UPI0013146511|nr:hypothetical protein [Collinsella sp. AF37-9]